MQELLPFSHLVFVGYTPAVRSDSPVLLLHVGLDLSVLGSLLLFTRRRTARVLAANRAEVSRSAMLQFIFSKIK